MASFADVRTGLAVACRDADAVKVVFERTPESVATTPAVIVLPADPVAQYHQTTSGGSGSLAVFRFDVVVIAGRWGDGAGQDQLDALISTDAGALVDAIEADQTLGGAAVVTKATEVTDYGSVSVAGTEYIGCRLSVEVHA